MAGLRWSGPFWGDALQKGGFFRPAAGDPLRREARVAVTFRRRLWVHSAPQRERWRERAGQDLLDARGRMPYLERCRCCWGACSPRRSQGFNRPDNSHIAAQTSPPLSGPVCDLNSRTGACRSLFPQSLDLGATSSSSISRISPLSPLSP